MCLSLTILDLLLDVLIFGRFSQASYCAATYVDRGTLPASKTGRILRSFSYESIAPWEVAFPENSWKVRAFMRETFVRHFPEEC